MPMEYIVPSLRISAFTEMDDPDVMKERLAKILELEEDRFIAGFQQQVQKSREKTCMIDTSRRSSSSRVILCSYMTANS